MYSPPSAISYLDANATEPLRPVARQAALAALDEVGNPSSVHRAGRAARRRLEAAREAIAARFAGRPTNLVFTSGGTEADALAICGLRHGRRLVIGATEHDAVRAAARGGTTEDGATQDGATEDGATQDGAALGVAVRRAAVQGTAVLAVDRDGIADLGALARLIAEAPALVCLMLANNETGVIQPVAEAASLCRAAGAWLHVDAVQAAGRIAVDFAALGAQSMALSSHKLGGPAGAGALLLSDEAAATLRPLIVGGGQERGRRGGTPAVPAIAGFAAAALEATGGEALAALRDAAEAAAVAAGAVVIGAGAPRLPNTSCVALPGVKAETQVIALDLAGIAVSAGAACSSGKVGKSHVLEAMGLGALAGEAIRVSLPWNATEADVAAFARAYGEMAKRLSRRAA